MLSAQRTNEKESPEILASNISLINENFTTAEFIEPNESILDERLIVFFSVACLLLIIGCYLYTKRYRSTCNKTCCNKGRHEINITKKEAMALMKGKSMATDSFSVPLIN